MHDDEFLTVDEFAERSGFSPDTIRRWLRSRKLLGSKEPESDYDPSGTKRERWVIDARSLEPYLRRPLSLKWDEVVERLGSVDRALARAVKDAETHNGMLSAKALEELRGARRAVQVLKAAD